MPMRGFNGNTVMQKPRMPRVLTMGGSMAAYHINQTADILDYENRGVLCAASARMGCPMRISSIGVAGSTSAAAVSVQLPQLQPGQYEYVALFIGGNDIIAGVDIDLVTIPNIKAIINRILECGAIPLLFTTPPYSAGALTADQLRAQFRLNDWIMRAPSIYGTCFAYDLYSDWIDRTSATNAFLTNLTYDFVHPSGRGTWQSSIGVETWLRYVVGIATRSSRVVSINDNWAASGVAGATGINLLSSGASFMQGVNGTTANLTANPCTFTLTNPVPGNSPTDRIELLANSNAVAGMTCTVTTGTDSDGTPFMQLALNISASGQQMYIRSASVHANATDQQWYEAEAYTTWANGGSVKPAECVLFMSMEAALARRASIGFSQPGTLAQGFMTDMAGVLATPRKKYLTAYALLQPVLRYTFVNVGTCTIKVRQMGVFGYSTEFGE